MKILSLGILLILIYLLFNKKYIRRTSHHTIAQNNNNIKVELDSEEVDEDYNIMDLKKRESIDLDDNDIEENFLLGNDHQAIVNKFKEMQLF